MSSRNLAVTPASQAGKAVEVAVGSSQPVVYGVAAGTIFGVHFNEWIMIGSAILLVLNLGLAVTRIITLYYTKKDS
tara:strand:+ start:176 stop:403 length:228 start_codon:yes stop_codon:yes gene_type:complete